MRKASHSCICWLPGSWNRNRTRPDAHLGKKRSTLWTGYKVHLTETCEPTLPHVIVHVGTTPAPRTDEAMTEAIEQELYQADVPSAVHLVDAGYMSARVFVNSQQRFGIEVLGPVSIDTQWQAHTPSGIDASQFVLDWEKRQATCPQGKTSTNWSWLSRKSHPDLIKIQFSTTDCRSCPRLYDGVRSTSRYPRRTLVIRPQAQHAALQAARKLQQSETFQQRYALRAGIEATISQGYGPLTCADLGMWACQKRMYSTWPLLRRSIWFALSIGLMVTHLLLPAFQLLRGSTRLPEEFASSVKSGSSSDRFVARGKQSTWLNAYYFTKYMLSR